VFKRSENICVGTDLSETSDCVVYPLASHDGYSCFDTLSHIHNANAFHMAIFGFSGKILECTLKICYGHFQTFLSVF